MINNYFKISYKLQVEELFFFDDRSMTFSLLAFRNAVNAREDLIMRKRALADERMEEVQMSVWKRVDMPELNLVAVVGE